MDAPKKLSPYEQRLAADAESRARHVNYQAEMKARAASTAASMAQKDAEQARLQATENEAAFRAEELQKYLNAGGVQMDFDANWPRLRQQLVERAYLEGRTLAPQSETAAAAKRHLDLLYRKDS